MSLKLKQVLAERGMPQGELAVQLGISRTAVVQILNHGYWPTRLVRKELEDKILDFLGCADRSVFEENRALVAQGAEPTHDAKQEQETDMLLKKHVLSPEARKSFGIVRDPFDEVQSADQVYMTPDARYVRESLRSIARHGGFAAVVGESGAGKSTLRCDLLQWTRDQAQEVIVIEPYILGMEDNDKKGKTLKAAQIAESIMRAVMPEAKLRQSSEARFHQVHQALLESHRAGMRHLLIIEEAHSIPIAALRHLKRFIELKDGFNRLLSVVLIGQPELEAKLNERDPNVREIVQRCQVIHLRPLDNELEGYLKHRFSGAGLDVAKLLPASATEALRIKLSGRTGSYSLLYPLAVHNVLTAAFNEAARLGVPQLSADLIRGV